MAPNGPSAVRAVGFTERMFEAGGVGGKCTLEIGDLPIGSGGSLHIFFQSFLQYVCFSCRRGGGCIIACKRISIV